MKDGRDKRLVLACRQGDRAAYAQLVERHYRRVFGLCLGITGSVHDAEDIAQEAMVKGYKKIRELRDADQFDSWIIRIAKNLCIDLFRKNERHREAVTERAEQMRRSPGRQLDIKSAIGKLSMETRQPLVMYYFQDRDTQSIASELGISNTGVWRLIRRARMELHELLSGQGESQ